MNVINEVEFGEKEVKVRLLKENYIIKEITQFVENYTRQQRLHLFTFGEEKTQNFKDELIIHYEAGKTLSINITEELKNALPGEIQKYFIKQDQVDQPVNMFLFDPTLLEPITTVAANLITIFSSVFTTVQFLNNRYQASNSTRDPENTNEEANYLIIGNMKIPTKNLSEETIKELCLEALRRQV